MQLLITLKFIASDTQKIIEMLSIVVNKLEIFDKSIQQHNTKLEILQENVTEIKNQLNKMEKTEDSEWWRVCIILCYFEFIFDFDNFINHFKLSLLFLKPQKI